MVEGKYNSANENLKSSQEKFAVLRENKARFEATIEGIDQRKMDLIYLIKNELRIDNINNLIGISDLNENIDLPSVEEQEDIISKLRGEIDNLSRILAKNHGYIEDKKR